MSHEAEIAAAVIAEREACAKACEALACWVGGGLLNHIEAHVANTNLRKAAESIRSRPAPAPDALDRALRACADEAWDRGGQVRDKAVEAAIAAGRAALGGGA